MRSIKGSGTNYKLVFLSIAIALCKGTAAQDSAVFASPESYFKISFSYLSNAVYSGRKDSLTLPYLTPTITYHNKSGFYLQASLSYLASSRDGQVDAGSITGGYDFYSKNDKLSGDVYVSKYFYNDASASVRSQVSALAGSYFSYNTGLVSLQTEADVLFASKPDLNITAGISHDFIMGNTGAFSITPAATVNAGTQNFHDDYVTQRKFSPRRKKRIGNVNAANIIVEKKDFAVLNYELSLPLNYDGNRWGLFISPVYAIPVNPLRYSLNKGVTYRTESLSNSFYAEVGAYIKF